MPAKLCLQSATCSFLLAATSATDPVAVPLVKAGGSVKYTVHFITGKASIPSGSTLHLQTTSAQEGGITAVTDSPQCIAIGTSNTQVSLTPGSPIIAGSLDANRNWTCTFDVLVTDVHQAAGQIDPFDVQFSITGPDVTAAFYVPKTTTLPVYVYTGNTFNSPVASVVDNDADGFFACK